MLLLQAVAFSARLLRKQQQDTEDDDALAWSC